ncbi:MAG: chemotaxis protein CheD [Pseudomonadota bacterium]
MTRSASSVYVPQGHFEVISTPSAYTTAVLGSCVAACLWDEHMHVGGMNHLLLPPEAASESGVNLMELLINSVLKSGARKKQLKVKLFGGSRMINTASDIGARNAEFAREFFGFEGIDIIAESLGGDKARRIQFWPATGKARMRFVSDETIEKPAPPRPKPVEPVGDIDLF